MSDVQSVLQGLNEIAFLVNSEKKVGELGVWDDLLNLIEKLIRKLLGEFLKPISDYVSDIYSEVKEGIKTKLKAVTDTISDVITSVKTILYNRISEVITLINGLSAEIAGAINDVLSDIGDAIRDVIGNLIEAVRDVIDGLRSIGERIANAIAGALQNISTYISNAIRNAITAVRDWLTNLVETVSDWVGEIYFTIRDFIVGVYERVRDWIVSVYEGVRDWIKGIIEHLKNVYESVRETVEGKIHELLLWFRDVAARVSAWWDSVLQGLGKWLGEVVLPKFGTVVEAAQTLVKWGSTVWDLIKAGNWDKAFDTIDAMFKGLGIPAPVETLHALLSAIAYFWESIRLQFIPMEIAASKRANIALGLDPVGLETAAQAVIRGNATLNEYYYNAALAGVTRDRADMALAAVREIPTPGAIQEAFLRGEISEDEHDDYLRMRGYSERDIKLFKTLYWFIPPPNDLIRMSVREVFTPDVAEKFGQYEDYPEIFTEWAVKQGISAEWARRYWAAHWDLPSPTMGFEMFHRRIIDENELKLLLRALDVMPYWREKLIQLSYNPLTRVDVRRMYKLGVLSEEDVYNAYLDLGYSPENAERLTEFTKRYSAPEDTSELDDFRQLARSTYAQAYKRKVISRDEYREFLLGLGYHPDDVQLLINIDDAYIAAADKLFDITDYRKDTLKLILSAYNRGLYHRNTIYEMLLDMGYTPQEAELELDLVDYNRQLGLRNVIVEKISEQYIEYIISEIEVIEKLNAFGFSDEEVAKLLEEWNISRSLRSKRPPLSDIRRFYEAGLLTTDEYLNELRGMGYNEKYIEMYKELLRV